MSDKRRYYKELRMSQLQAFVQLARGNGFAAAANELELSTPTVWNQVRALEDEFGQTLVQVKGRTVTLTEHGKLLASLVSPIVEGFESLAERFAQEVGLATKTLAIASPSNILINELPSPFRIYRERCPEVEINLVDMPSVAARRAVEEGEVDLAVAGLLDNDLPSNMEVIPVTDFPFCIACNHDHPLLSTPRVTPKSIVKHSLILSAKGTNTRTRIDEVFARYGLIDQMNVACEASTKEICLQYVEMGFGITIAPLSQRYQRQVGSPSSGARNLAFRDISKTFGREPIVVIRRRDRYEPEHQITFRDLVCKNVD
jgi:DNA-binding transcriptional LysR family regulator